MSLKDKIMNIVVAHPKLVTLGIGLAITLAVAAILGLTSPEHVFARSNLCLRSGQCSTSNI